MYARHRLDPVAGAAIQDTGPLSDALSLRREAALPPGLAGMGPLSLTAANGLCRLEAEQTFDDVWSLGADWLLTGEDFQCCWPNQCWPRLSALPGRRGRPVSLHCLGAQGDGRLTLQPREEGAAIAMEQLVCRYLSPRQWCDREPAVSAPAPPPTGQWVAPETLPSVFTLAWSRELALDLALPLCGASLHCQAVPSAPLWRGSLCMLQLGRHRLALDCARVTGVLRQQSRCHGRVQERVLVLGDGGRPLLRLGSPARREWRELLGQVLYSPRGETLSK